MKSDAKPTSFTLNADGLLRRVALATLLASASGLAMAQTADQAPVSATTPDSPIGTTTQGADAVAIPSGTTPSSDAPANSGSSVNLEKVVVTGSRIRSVNAASVSPVTTVGAAEFKYQGTTRVEDLLNSLPQTFAGQGSSVSNGADGTATVDLRGLGPQRTLTLIDGKRVQAGDPRGSSAVDLNFIPAAMVERVDVLTGGASAVYGADAVAGVVNFILRKNFSGVRVDVQRSGYQHDNDIGSSVTDANRAAGFNPPSGSTFGGKGWDVSAIMGVNTDDNRGNVTAYVTYRSIDAVTQADRDYSFCQLSIRDADSYLCGGSSTSFPGRFRAGTGTTRTDFTLNEANGGTNFRAFRGSGVPNDLFNFNPYNYYQRNDERYTLGAVGRYKFNDAAEAYSQVMFMDDQTNAVIAPSGAFGVIANINTTTGTPNSNPLLTQAQRDQLRATQPGNPDSVRVQFSRRNVEGGGRDDNLGHMAYRLLGGVRGDLTDNISYDVSAQLGVTTYTQTYRNDFSNVRLARALDVVTDANGNAACRSAVNGTDPNCVPYNIYRIGGVSQAALQYLQVPLLSTGRLEERVATASLNGTIPQTRLPTANEGLGFSAGLEYRQEKTGTTFDNSFITGDGAGQGGPRLSTPPGGYQVKDVFGEVRMPFLQDLPGAKELSTELGYRYSSYNLFDSTNTYKIGLNYLPIQSLKLRASFNRAVRVPTVNEYFGPVSVGIDGSIDPCSGPTPAYTAAQCANDPFIAANPGAYGNIENNPANQYNGRVGSAFVANGTKLQAEQANTYTAGFVFTPDAVKNLTVSADYYRIKIKDRLNGYGANSILTACYTSGTLCNLINRDADGSLLTDTGFVTDLTVNAGTQINTGVDVNLNYRFNPRDFGFNRINTGSFILDYVGTRLLKADFQPVPGAPAADYSCVGQYGVQCSTGAANAPNFKYRHKMRLTWNTPLTGVNVSTAWRYFDKVRVDQLSKDTGNSNNLDGKIGSYSYIDLFVSAKVQNYTGRIGINNVFDRTPPVVNSALASNGNSFAQTYDVLGRYLFAGIQLDFGK